MLYRYSRKFKPLAQNLRRNMTREEKRLWYDFFKRFPITVNRQKQIGDYIVDFFIAEKRMVIEIDGIQHADKEQHEQDIMRDFSLRDLGLTILRYHNTQINENFESVCDDILKKIGLQRKDLKPPKEIGVSMSF